MRLRARVSLSVSGVVWCDCQAGYFVCVCDIIPVVCHIVARVARACTRVCVRAWNRAHVL